MSVKQSMLYLYFFFFFSNKDYQTLEIFVRGCYDNRYVTLVWRHNALMKALPVPSKLLHVLLNDYQLCAAGDVQNMFGWEKAQAFLQLTF